jgi:hypothetical protein
VNGELLPPENAKLSFANLADLKTRYQELDAQVHEGVETWAKESVETTAKGWRRLVPFLAEMRDVLSQKSKFHDKEDDELPGWTEWYSNLQVVVNQAFCGAVANQESPVPDMPELPSLRMVQIELKQLTDGTAPAAGASIRVHKGGRPKRSSTKTKKPTAKPTPASAAPAPAPTPAAHSVSNIAAFELAKLVLKTLGERESGLMNQPDNLRWAALKELALEVLGEQSESEPPPESPAPPPVTRKRESAEHKATREFQEKTNARRSRMHGPA